MVAMLRRVSFLLVAPLAACGLLLDVDSARDAGASTPDTSTFDDAALDTGVSDAVPIDAFVPSPCNLFSPAGLIAQYTFDADHDAVIVDDVAGRDGTISGGVAHIAGPCGDALKFGPSAGFDPLPHGRVDHDEAFALPTGSIEFFLRVPSGSRDTSFGVLGRDALGSDEPGHLFVFIAKTGEVVVRTQQPESPSATDTRHLCSASPIIEDSWTHVLINFGDGGAELFVDGVRDDPTATGVILNILTGWAPEEVDCGKPRLSIGFDDLTEPWILGAASVRRSADDPNILDVPFADGAIDELRIRSVRLTPGS